MPGPIAPDTLKKAPQARWCWPNHMPPTWGFAEFVCNCRLEISPNYAATPSTKCETATTTNTANQTSTNSKRQEPHTTQQQQKQQQQNGTQQAQAQQQQQRTCMTMTHATTHPLEKSGFCFIQLAAKRKIPPQKPDKTETQLRRGPAKQNGTGPIERPQNDKPPNDTSTQIKRPKTENTTPFSQCFGSYIKVIAEKVHTAKKDEDPPNEPPPANDNAPQNESHKRARQKNERQTNQNEDARHRTTEPPDKPHTRFGGLNESVPDNPQTHLSPVRNPIEEGTRPRYERVPHRRSGCGTTRYRLTTNTKMKTRQRNPPQGMTTPPPHGNQQRDPPKRVPNETAEPRSETRPDHTPATAVQTTGPTVNRQATAPLPLKWPATSPPCPDEEAEGTTHPLGRFLRMVPHPLKRDGTTHLPMRVCGATK
ncbi:hypothetical protein BS47DRAFT_1363349 [Hydnum rufescens UP504]|uniref:Uncharacterized protein n=1 Tax=Hydnum rufescens UP504 TaxID=1448309 RepID=A0A9P6AUH7_9AGAM|nr:hypothetical protein BS47DRAFT_1363349 [Hydnum rufescens UP504]